MTPGETARLKRLCVIFEVPQAVTNDNPEGALVVLSYIYAMPAIKNHAERRNFGNQILQTNNIYFPVNAQFSQLVRVHVITIQEIPSWYWEMAATPEALVRAFKYWTIVVVVVGALGLGSAVQALNGAVATGLSRERLRDGITPAAKMAIQRLAGKSPIVDALLKRYGLIRTGVAAGEISAAAPLILIGVAALMALLATAKAERARLQQVILDRYQSGQMSKQLFDEAQVFTIGGVGAEDIKKYYEMK